MRVSVSIASFVAIALLFLTALDSAWAMFWLALIGLVVLSLWQGSGREARGKQLGAAIVAMAVAIVAAVLLSRMS